VRIAHIVDDAERCLDRLGIARAHLAGNSMGGWVALELARRGRALSVCALSPAGIWDQSHEVGQKLRRVLSLTRASRSLIPLLARSATFRRFAMRDNATYGDRVGRDEMLRLVDDMLGCDVASDLLSTDESFSELSADCPVTIAWSEHDRIFPIEKHRPLAEKMIADAYFHVLKDVGHVPMLDNPALVVETILDACALTRTVSERVPTDVFRAPALNLASLAARAER
jgi:pimeloyl-ACP methyl ester carboxylesterase